jgi:hypothetical protein
MFFASFEHDNAAFADEGGSPPGANGLSESARILRKLADTLEAGGPSATEGGTLADLNGNRVGSWHFQQTARQQAEGEPLFPAEEQER